MTQTPIRAETDAIETTASPSNGRSRGCTPKRVRSSEEVEALARILPDDKAAQAIVPPDSPARHEEPEFKFQPASLANWSGTRISRPEQTLPQPKPAPVLAPAVDVDAVIAALFGRGPPIMDSVPTPPANAAVGEGREQACSTHPTRAAPASTGSDLVAGSKRLVD